MKKEIFKKGLALLLKTFPNKEISPEVSWAILKDLTDAEFETAVLDIISTRAEIYPNTNMIALIRTRARKQDRLTSGEAWSMVLSEVRRVGSYGQPDFKDPLISKAVECVGWKSICLSETIGVERAHFFKAYDSLDKRESEEQIRLPKMIDGILKTIEAK